MKSIFSVDYFFYCSTTKDIIKYVVEMTTLYEEIDYNAIKENLQILKC
jgi:hypothetical protein